MADTGLRVLAVAWTELPVKDFEPNGDLFVYVKKKLNDDSTIIDQLLFKRIDLSISLSPHFLLY